MSIKTYPEKHIRLTDGRKLSFEDVGAPNGTPIFYFHGVPSARVEWHMWGNEALLQDLGIRLIAVDRPGVGASTFQPHRGLSDWPADILALADALGIQRFSVIGYSGGGPYAAVCAAKIPQRLQQVALVSSLAPFDIPAALVGLNPGNVKFLNVARQRPWVYRLLYRQVQLLAKFAPQQYLKRALVTFESADRAAFARPEVHNAIFGCNGTGRGQQVDTAIILNNWDFNLGEIPIPVQLWHGEQDHNASMTMHQYLVRSIPQAIPHLISGEGHISLMVNHAREILKALQ
jgi:pimeloyl-ACP methyl ester carboxylesterase